MERIPKYLLILFLSNFLLVSCDQLINLNVDNSYSNISVSNNISITSSQASSLNSTYDSFAYYKDSVFIFLIKDGSSTITTTKMTWIVFDYDNSTGVASISNILDPSSTKTPLSMVFYFKKGLDGALEYSSDKFNWKKITSVSIFNFLFFTKVSKPSRLYGSVKNGIKTVSVNYPGGNSIGCQIYSEYNASGYDPYYYVDYSKEIYCKEVGFAGGETFCSDQSDYPPFVYKRVIDLVYYKIIEPNGTIREGGTKKPNPPEILSVKYYENVEVWNSKTGRYEKRSYVGISWKDNSDNEVGFKIYLATNQDRTFRYLDDYNSYVFSAEGFTANSTSGTIRIGYYCNWPSGLYCFKLSATSIFGESDLSGEFQLQIGSGWSFSSSMSSSSSSSVSSSSSSFDNIASNFVDDGSGCWRVYNGEYIMDGYGGNHWRYTYYNNNYSNFTFSVDLKQKSGDFYAYGIYFRSPDGIPTNNGYVLNLSSDGYWYLGKYVNGTFYFINSASNWVYSSYIYKYLDSKNNLKVNCSGSEITIYINSIFIEQVTDYSFSSGKLGLNAYDPSGYNNDYAFSNIIITLPRNPLY